MHEVSMTLSIVQVVCYHKVALTWMIVTCPFLAIGTCSETDLDPCSFLGLSVFSPQRQHASTGLSLEAASKLSKS